MHNAFLSHQRQMRSSGQHSTAQHSTAQHSTAQHSTAQHSLQMPTGGAHLEIMDCILLIGSPPKGNQDRVLPPSHKALGVGQRVPHQLKMFQVVQLHRRLFGHFNCLQYNNRTTFVPIWSRGPSPIQDGASCTVASPSLLALQLPAVKQQHQICFHLVKGSSTDSRCSKLCSCTLPSLLALSVPAMK